MIVITNVRERIGEIGNKEKEKELTDLEEEKDLNFRIQFPFVFFMTFQKPP